MILNEEASKEQCAVNNNDEHSVCTEQIINKAASLEGISSRKDITANKMILTIGYETRSFAQILHCCSLFGIRRLIDVREYPYDSYKGQYNRQVLSNELHRDSISYCYMGDSLGEKPSNEEFYTEGVCDYEKLSARPEYKKAIIKLLHMCDGHSALFSSHANPMNSHRGLMIGRSLKELGVTVNHIVGKDMPTIITQQELEEKLVDKYFPDRWLMSFPFLEEPLSMQDMTNMAYKLKNKKTGARLNQDLIMINKRKAKETKEQKREKTFLLLEKGLADELGFFEEFQSDI